MREIEICRDGCEMTIRTGIEEWRIQRLADDVDEYYETYYCDWGGVFDDLMWDNGWEFEIVG